MQAHYGRRDDETIHAAPVPRTPCGPFEVAGWRIDPAAREATDGRQTKRLTPKAMGVLTCLANAGQRVVFRDELLETVWPDVIVGEETLTHAIAELRRAFGDKPGRPRLIETVRKAGYRLLEPVRALEPRSAASGCCGFDLEAYALCCEARTLIDLGGPGRLEQAERLGAEAVARAPGFAPGWAEFAIAAVYRRLYCDRHGATLAAAEEAAQTAVRLQKECALAHAAHGLALSALGHHDRADKAFALALTYGPQDFDAHFLFARARFAAGDMRTAALLAEHAAQLRPEDYRALCLASPARLGMGDQMGARRDAALGLGRVDRLLALDPDLPRARSTRACLLAALGRSDEALETVAANENVHPLAYANVVAMARAGEVTLALDRLEEAIDRGLSHAALLRADPALAFVRRERRFSKLVGSIEAA